MSDELVRRNFEAVRQALSGQEARIQALESALSRAQSEASMMRAEMTQMQQQVSVLLSMRGRGPSS